MPLVEHITGVAPGTANAVTSVRFRTDDADTQDFLAPVLAPANVSATSVAAITASLSPQSVNITDQTSFADNEYLIIDAGTDNQEVVRAALGAGGSTLTAIFRKSHLFGAKLMKITGAYSKILRFNVGSSAYYRFRRTGALPTGVYDQYRTLTVYAQGSSTPITSDATHVLDCVPTTDKEFAGTKLIELQWLVTSGALRSPSLTNYRWSWDA